MTEDSHASNLDAGGSQAQQVIHPETLRTWNVKYMRKRRLHLAATDP